jgi:uncharacterized protein (UPF0303 family)
MSPALTPEEITNLITSIEDEERRLILPRFDNNDAWHLGNILVQLAQVSGASVVIDIRRHGQQLFHSALPGTCADNDEWIQRKTRVVDRYGTSSYLVGLRHLAQGSSFEQTSRLDPNLYAAHGGAFPLTVRNVGTVGTVTVSGLPQADDHRLVVKALEAHLEIEGA